MPDSTSIASEFSTRDFLRPWLRCMCSIRLCSLLTAAYVVYAPDSQSRVVDGVDGGHAPCFVADERRGEDVDEDGQHGARVPEKAVLEKHLWLSAWINTRMYAEHRSQSKRWQWVSLKVTLIPLRPHRARDCHVPMTSTMRVAPRQFTTRFCQTAHTRHHTMLSPIMI